MADSSSPENNKSTPGAGANSNQKESQDPNEPMKVELSNDLSINDSTVPNPGSADAAMALLRATWKAELWSPAVGPIKSPVLPPAMPDSLTLDPLTAWAAASAWPGAAMPPFTLPGSSPGQMLLAPGVEDNSTAPTTVMLRNIPNKYTRAMLLE